MIALAGPQDAHFVEAMWNVCFPEDPPETTSWYFAHAYRAENTLCAIENGQIRASLQCVPYTISAYGRPLSSRTLTGVCTDPNHRGRGYARELMRAALSRMNAANVAICFLFTHIPDFYRKYGWEYCTQATRITVVPQPCNELTVVKHIPHMSALNALYLAYLKDINLYVLRTHEQWQLKIAEMLCDGCTPIAAYRGLQLVAFAFYKDSDSPSFAELYYTDPHAPAAMTDRTATALIPGDGIMRNMCRVTDVTALLNDAPCDKNDTIIIKVTDDFCPQNAGRYALIGANGRLSAQKTTAHPDITLDISTLVRIACGAHIKPNPLSDWFPRATNFTYEIC